jgi:hypothetical protein
MATWDDVRAAAADLPEVEDGTAYREPALKIGGKAFACLSPHEKGALVLWCDLDERDLIVDSDPEMFYVTDHYQNWPNVLVRLENADVEKLKDRLAESWLIRAPRKLAKEFEG